jgi:hypothetical protein
VAAHKLVEEKKKARDEISHQCSSLSQLSFKDNDRRPKVVEIFEVSSCVYLFCGSLKIVVPIEDDS